MSRPDVEVALDLDALAESLKQPENARALVRLLLRAPRSSLTTACSPVPDDAEPDRGST